jgi:hypothetical protein
MLGLPAHDNNRSRCRSGRTQTNLRQLRSSDEAGLRGSTHPPQGNRLGKRLNDSRSPAASAGPSPRNLFARHTLRKQNKYMKQGEPSARRRPGSTVASINAEQRRSGTRLLLAIFAEKERKKMTHLKQTTSYLQAQGIQQGSCQPTEAATGAEATNPCPRRLRPCTGHTPPTPRRQFPGTGQFLAIRHFLNPDRKSL